MSLLSKNHLKEVKDANSQTDAFEGIDNGIRVSIKDVPLSVDLGSKRDLFASRNNSAGRERLILSSSLNMQTTVGSRLD